MIFFKAAILIIARDWDRVRIIVPLISLLIFFLWLSHWGMDFKEKIDERETIAGRYAGLESISYTDEGK